jgi:hypothetical protein
MGRRDIYRVLVGKCERKGPLGRPRRRWEDIMIDHKWDGGGAVMDWIDLAQNKYRWWALVNKVTILQVP